MNWRGAFSIQAVAMILIAIAFQFFENRDVDVMESERLTYGYKLNAKQ